jgi:hypothetical protein
VCALEPDAARVFCATAKVLPPFHQILGQGYVHASSCFGVLRANARRMVREASDVRWVRIALERLPVESEVGDTSVLSPDWRDVLEQLKPFYALRSHRRTLVRAGDENLEQLGYCLQRAVDRHGVFPSLAAATSFVVDTLTGGERRLKRRAITVSVVLARCAVTSSAVQRGPAAGSRGSFEGYST